MKKTTATTQKKLTGRLRWAYHSEDPVDEALVVRSFLRGPREAYLEIIWDGWLYPIALHSADGFVFKANFNATFGLETSPVAVTARYYSHGNRHAFIGEWTEESTDLLWWAELQEVAHFVDQGETPAGG